MINQALTQQTLEEPWDFFDSEIVQQEAKSLFEDYQALTQLGSDYGKFDRDGKIIFIQKMEGMMERYRHWFRVMGRLEVSPPLA